MWNGYVYLYISQPVNKKIQTPKLKTKNKFSITLIVIS